MKGFKISKLWLPLRAMLYSLIVFNLGATSSQAVEKSSEGKQEELAKAEDNGRQAFLQKGWFGTSVDDLVRVAVTSMPDRSEGAKSLNQLFKKNVSIVQVTVVNLSLEKMMADSSQAKINLHDGSQVQCLPLLEVLNSAISGKKKVLELFQGPHQIAAKKSYYNIMIFLPFGFDWQQVKSVSLEVGGVQRVVAGQIFSDEEKARLYEEGLKVKQLESVK